MAHHIGTDIIEISRIEKAINRWGEHFLRRVYTQPELSRYGGSPQSLAARFAGKEAVIKLLGGGEGGLAWREIEILSQPNGKPLLNLYGRARHQANRLGIKEIAVSLAHSKEHAIASAIGTTEAGDAGER